MKNKMLIYIPMSMVLIVVLLIVGFSQTGNAREINNFKTVNFNDLSFISVIAISHDDRLLFVGGWKEGIDINNRKCIGYVYSLQTDELQTTFIQHFGFISGACFSPDDKSIVTTGFPYSVWYWDIQSGNVLLEFKTGATKTPYNNGSINGLDFFRGGKKIITGDDMGNIQVWNLGNGDQLMYSNPLYTGGGVHQIKGLDLFQNDEKVLVYGGATPAEVRSTKSGTYLYSIGANAIVIDPNERFFLGTIENFFQRYDINTGAAIEKISTFNENRMHGLNNVFSPNGEFLINNNQSPREGDSPYPTITDVRSGQIIGDLTAEKSDQIIQPDLIEFSPSGNYLFISKGNSISIFSMNDLSAGVKGNY